MNENQNKTVNISFEDKKNKDYITKLELENELLKKQRIKYRNIVNNHIMDKDDLQKEIERLINENVILVDEIKRLRIN